MFGLWNGGRDKFHKCEYWSTNKDKNLVNKNQLVHNYFPTGTFMAKMSDSETDEKQNVADAFQFDASYVTLETFDDVRDLKTNNIVRFLNKIYMVDNIVKIPVRKNAEQFLDDFVPYKTYISLRG